MAKVQPEDTIPMPEAIPENPTVPDDSPQTMPSANFIDNLQTDAERESCLIRQKADMKNRTTKMKYGGESKWARMAYSPYFESCTMAIIVFNALWIGIDTQWNHANLATDGVLPLEPVSIVIENFFCVYFTIELTIRFLAFREKQLCFFDSWFVFDTTLVACMIFETWVMVIVEAIMASEQGGGVGPLSALRLLRLLRLARMGRLMKFVPELGKLVKGMVRAAKAAVFIIIFLVLVIYVFSIIFTSSLGDREKYPLTPYCSWERRHGINNTADVDDELELGNGMMCLDDGDFGPKAQDLFATMGDSFMTLFTRGVLADNLDETVDAILAESLILMWMFFIFLIITFATLLNMLIGVVCEVISDAAASEDEIATVSSLKETIEDAFDEIDTNDDGLVCPREWAKIKDNQHVRKSFSNIGIEDERMEERLKQMEEMIFDFQLDESGEMTRQVSEPAGACGRSGLKVQELISKVVSIRPDQGASALDLELVKAQTQKDHKYFKKTLAMIEGKAKIQMRDKFGTDANDDDIGFPTRSDSNMQNGASPKPMKNGTNSANGNMSNNRRTFCIEDFSTQMLFQALEQTKKAEERS